MARLTAATRRSLPKKDFAVPSKAPKSGSYPINDRSHARNALARSAGKPVASQVRAAVGRRFPGMGQGYAMGGGVMAPGQMGAIKRSDAERGMPRYLGRYPMRPGFAAGGSVGLAANTPAPRNPMPQTPGGPAPQTQESPFGRPVASATMSPFGTPVQSATMTPEPTGYAPPHSDEDTGHFIYPGPSDIPLRAAGNYYRQGGAVRFARGGAVPNYYAQGGEVDVTEPPQMGMTPMHPQMPATPSMATSQTVPGYGDGGQVEDESMTESQLRRDMRKIRESQARGETDYEMSNQRRGERDPSARMPMMRRFPRAPVNSQGYSQGGDVIADEDTDTQIANMGRQPQASPRGVKAPPKKKMGRAARVSAFEKKNADREI